LLPQREIQNFNRYTSQIALTILISKQCNTKELHNLYSSPNIIRMIKSRGMKGARHVARMGETRNVYRILVGKPEGRRPLGRPRRRGVDNIKMDLKSEHGDEPSGSL
jgi:hypothetical protein